MARTVLNQTLSGGGASYTVPASKVAIFAAHLGNSGGGAPVLQFGSDPVAVLGAGVSEAKPLVAAAGTVISVTGVGSTGKISLSGFLYDV